MAVNGGVARLFVTLLGGFEVRLASGPPLALPSRKTEALLAYLARQPGRPVARDTLAALLWGDTADRQARKNLRQALYVLRKTLPGNSPALRVDPGHFMLDPAYLESDVAEFERAVANGSPEALERAATLYRGDFLEGFLVSEAPFEEWLMAERERLRELALEALARLLAHQSSSGPTERAIQTAVRLLALDPLQEVVHRTLMRLYARQGRRSAALRQYQVCVEVLQRELGAEPEAETKHRYQEILQHAPVAPGRSDERTRPAPRGRAPRVARSPRSLDVPLGETPLVGRDAELGRLRNALHEAQQGRGGVAAVVGEAGVGKSRLLMALAAEAIAGGGRILFGRAYQTEQILAFGPWVSALRSPEVVSETGVLESLAAPQRAEVARLVPELGAAGAEVPAPSGDHLRLFESVTALLTRLAAQAPLLLLLDDLHWADEMTLKLTAFVGRRIPASPILLAITAREEELPGAPVLRAVLEELGREPHFTDVPLRPLSRPDSASLVRALARAGSDETSITRLGEQVWRLGEGNPFVVVETMRALREGAIPETPGELPLPERVYRLVTSRLERLSGPAQHLASVAAVIGGTFDFALAQRATGLDPPLTAAALEELVRRRIVHGVDHGFDFTHEHIREVAYAIVLPARRQLLHGAVAATLETLHREDLASCYVALGLHYQAAEVWEKAAIYLHEAGKQAASRSAHRAGATLLEHALNAMERPRSPGPRWSGLSTFGWIS